VSFTNHSLIQQESESLFAMMFGRRSRRVALTDKQVKKQRVSFMSLQRSKVERLQG